VPPEPTAVEVSTLNAGSVNGTMLAVGALALIAGLATLAVLARRR
jgi:hypothetical protein